MAPLVVLPLVGPVLFWAMGYAWMARAAGVIK